MLPDKAVESTAGFDELAGDWLAALVRDALIGAYGGAEPPAVVWRRIRLAVNTYGTMHAKEVTAAEELEPETAVAIRR
jgi:hypothetical protein